MRQGQKGKFKKRELYKGEVLRVAGCKVRRSPPGRGQGWVDSKGTEHKAQGKGLVNRSLGGGLAKGRIS